ncbi:hypothetical protein Ahy_B02g057192 [Arachis hypogaea]|uniref:Borealin C-terminal domain-containing protein n=1 Tax=Arachis hypogaea TaxID=3818 RepID=A0A445ABD1_ARAHY|nr:hypothetical protein Ahy_B02g057192 [Arachis hypogaea]
MRSLRWRQKQMEPHLVPWVVVVVIFLLLTVSASHLVSISPFPTLFIAGNRGNRSWWAGLRCRLLALSLSVRFLRANRFVIIVIIAEFIARTLEVEFVVSLVKWRRRNNSGRRLVAVLLAVVYSLSHSTAQIEGRCTLLLLVLLFLCSVQNEEQLRKPMLQVFKETLPNLSIVKDEGNGKFDVFEEPCEAQTLTSQEVLQTPNVSSQRLSVGMTPKTLRLPKPGEMLLSVHGSPLGVYKENNMEAIYDLNTHSIGVTITTTVVGRRQRRGGEDSRRIEERERECAHSRRENTKERDARQKKRKAVTTPEREREHYWEGRNAGKEESLPFSCDHQTRPPELPRNHRFE